MSLHQSLNIASSHPLPRLDALSFGIRGRLPAGSMTIPEIRAALAADPDIALTSRQEDRAEIGFKVFHLTEGSDSRVGHSLVNLHFSQRGSDLFVTSKSAIRVNPNTITRGLLSHDGVKCPLGLDGRENVLGAAAAAAARTMPVPEQIELVRQIMQNVADALMALLPPGFTDVHIWLKSAELGIDLPVPDAIAATRALQRSALLGSTASDRDVYRVSASDGQDGPVARWYNDGSGAYYKAHLTRLAAKEWEKVQ